MYVHIILEECNALLARYTVVATAMSGVVEWVQYAR